MTSSVHSAANRSPSTSLSNCTASSAVSGSRGRTGAGCSTRTGLATFRGTISSRWACSLLPSNRCTCNGNPALSVSSPTVTRGGDAVFFSHADLAQPVLARGLEIEGRHV